MQRVSFSDASFFFAIVDAADRWHRECLSLLNEMEKGGWQLVTTLLVVAETHVLLLRRLGYHVALLWLKSVLPRLTIVPIEPEDLNRVLEILERYSDKDFSLTDAISFAVMERLGISVALSVDHHFVEYGGGFFVAPLMGTKVPE
jgi:predicted nucleic acid-binding protein